MYSLRLSVPGSLKALLNVQSGGPVSAKALENHLTVLGVFVSILDHVRQSAPLTRRRANEVAPTSQVAMQAAIKSEDRTVREFLALAEARYHVFMRCLAWLLAARGEDVMRRAPLLPPWDVAIVWHAHMLSPSRYHTDMAGGMDASFRGLWSSDLCEFPLSKLASMANSNIWSDPESQARWDEVCCAMFGGQKYQLWSGYPAKTTTITHTLATVPIGPRVCGCGDGIASLTPSEYARYRLDEMRIRCSKCGELLPSYGDFNREALCKDLAAMLNAYDDLSRSEGPNKLSTLDATTDLSNTRAVKSDLDRLDLKNGAFWFSLLDTPGDWDAVLTAARRIQEEAKRAGTILKNKDVLVDICVRYQSYWHSVDVVEAAMAQEKSIRQIVNASAHGKTFKNRPEQFEQYHEHVSRVAVFDDFSQPNSDVELYWVTHLLKPVAYRDWCIKSFGVRPDHKVQLFPSLKGTEEALGHVADAHNVSTDGLKSQAPEKTFSSEKSNMIAFTQAECDESYRVCVSLTDRMRVLRVLVAQELLARVPASRSPCKLSQLRIACLRQVGLSASESQALKALDTANKLLNVFDGLRNMTLVTAWIDACLKATREDESSSRSSDKIKRKPVPNRTQQKHTDIYWYLLDKYAEICVTRTFEEEDRNGLWEDKECLRDLRMLVLKASVGSGVGFQGISVESRIWQYPRLCQKTLQMFGGDVDAYIAEARKAVLEDEDDQRREREEKEREEEERRVATELLAREEEEARRREEAKRQEEEEKQRLMQEEIRERAAALQRAEEEQRRLEEERQRQEAERLRRLTLSDCIICTDELPRDSFPSGYLTKACDHEYDVCTACLAQAIASELEQKSWERLSCPVCSALLESHVVEKFATAPTIERYHRFMINDAQKHDPLFRRCLNPSCSGGQVHESGGNAPIITCIFCGARACFIHEMPWHENRTCETYEDYLEQQVQDEEDARRRVQEESASQALVSRFRRCPGMGCSAPIEKISGCNHMTCRRCSHEFCWLCMGRWKPRVCSCDLYDG